LSRDDQEDHVAAAVRTTTSNRGRRVGLTRQRVIETAIVMIDRDGLDSFSLRRLAAEVDVEPMSLYNHVASKDDLLDGVVERIFAELTTSRGDRTASTWQDQMRRGARRFREVMLSHPQASIVVLTRRVLTDAPLDAMRGGLKPLLAAGMPTDEAILAVRSFSAYLTGTVLREVGATRSYSTSEPDRAEQRVHQLAETGDPLLAGVADEVAVVDHAAQFDNGVELFIAGIESTLATHV
jgi:TetR/AcrR family tetracycline transcriptional repressor